VFNFNDPQAFWLNVTNLALGVATAGIILALVVSIIRSAIEHTRPRSATPPAH
jgi:diacylglycerol kinase